MLRLIYMLILNLVFVYVSGDGAQITPKTLGNVNSKIDVAAVNSNLNSNDKLKQNGAQVPADLQPVYVKEDQGTKNDTKDEDKIDTNNSTVPHLHFLNKTDMMQSGALLRGFYVFLGLSVITMMYLICRSYRLRNGSQPSNTVRKYGVKARRSDIEMRPLEMDEEDDDTVFELNQNSRS